MFKIETENGKTLENVSFYGISSKRYVLYDGTNENNFTIHKCTLHGLGHLLDVDEKQWWNDILAMHYFPEKKQEILDKYENKYAVSKLRHYNTKCFEEISHTDDRLTRYCWCRIQKDDRRQCCNTNTSIP